MAVWHTQLKMKWGSQTLFPGQRSPFNLLASSCKETFDRGPCGFCSDFCFLYTQNLWIAFKFNKRRSWILAWYLAGWISTWTTPSTIFHMQNTILKWCWLWIKWDNVWEIVSLWYMVCQYKACIFFAEVRNPKGIPNAHNTGGTLNARIKRSSPFARGIRSRY